MDRDDAAPELTPRVRKLVRAYGQASDPERATFRELVGLGHARRMPRVAAELPEAAPRPEADAPPIPPPPPATSEAERKAERRRAAKRTADARYEARRRERRRAAAEAHGATEAAAHGNGGGDGAEVAAPPEQGAARRVHAGYRIEDAPP